MPPELKECSVCKYVYPACLIGDLSETVENICPLCAYEKHINPKADLPADTPPPRHDRIAYAMWEAARQYRAGEITDVEIAVYELLNDEEAVDKEIITDSELDGIVNGIEDVAKSLEGRERRATGVMTLLLDFARVCRSHQILKRRNEALIDGLKRIEYQGGAQGRWAAEVLERVAPARAECQNTKEN